MDNLKISPDRLKEITDSFETTKIMVIGDIMIDQYMWGDVNRISPEAPVPVVEVEDVTFRLGGGANVVQNLVKLGITPVLVSVYGDDSNGEKILEMLSDINCPREYLYRSSERHTTIKTRIMARQQQVVRADRESCNDLTDNELHNISEMFEKALSSVKAVIISDYGKGVICPVFLNKIITLCHKKEVLIAVDPKERHFDFYNGVACITPNLKEAHTALGIPYIGCPSDKDIEDIGWRLVDKLGLLYLLITLSERGMALFQREGKKHIHLPTVAQEVYDVTGAGDTVISLFTASLVCGATPVEAAFLANHAAGITLSELGTASVDIETLLKSCRASLKI